MRRIGRLLTALAGLLGFDPRWFEAASGSSAIIWAILLERSADQQAFPAYAPIEHFIRPKLLASLFAVAGSLQLYAAMRDHPPARIPLAAAMSSAWLLAGYGAWVGAPDSPTTGLLLCIGAWNAAAMLALISISLKTP